MSNSGFLFTDAGLAAASLASPTGPKIVVQSFRVADGVGYAPTRSQTSLLGNVKYTGVPSTYTIVNADTIDVTLPIDINIGDFKFGEIGLYDPTNVLLAVCVFDNLQEKIRAIGNQAGNRYRIHARLKLAQAPAICVVEVSDPMTLLEVPAWEFLFPPVDQLNDANAAIVHEDNASGDSILVIRDSDVEWTIVGYRKIFTGTTSDSGASATQTALTHPSLGGLFMQLPQPGSRYAVKFANGDIRRVMSQGVTNQIIWEPGLGQVPTGQITIWEDNSTAGASDFPIASMKDYNILATNFNRFWAAPTGTYNASNAGINQNPIPLLTSRPSLADWTVLSSSLRKLMMLENYTPSQYGAIIDSDWVVHVNDNNTDGLYFLEQKFGAIYNGINTQLDASRNAVNLTYLESQAVSALARARTTPFATTVVYDFTVAQPSEATRLGLANAGGAITITGAAGNQSVFFSGWATLYGQVGSIVVDRGTTYSSNGQGTGSALGVANMDGTLRQLYTHSYVISALSATASWTLQGKINGNGSYTFKLIFGMTGSPYGTATPGTMSVSVAARRPITTLINNPAFAYYSGAQLGTSTF